MARGDRRLDVAAACHDRPHAARPDQALVPPGDQRAVPARAVLAVEGNDASLGVDARVEPRGVEGHQREERQRVRGAECGLVREELREVHRIAAQLTADRLLAGREVALVEQQVEGGVRRLEDGGAILRAGQREVHALEALADPHHALQDRGLGGDEGARGGGHVETAQRPQDQRELALGPEAGVAAHEDHAELVVPDEVLAEGLPHRRGQCPLPVEVAREVGGERAPRPLAADRVDRTVAGRREQPRRRVVRDPRLPPGLEGGHERRLDDVLRQLQVVRPEEPREDRDQPAGLAAEHRLDLAVDRSWSRAKPRLLHERERDDVRA